LTQAIPTMTGKKLLGSVWRGDASTVRTLLSERGAQSFINYQEVGEGEEWTGTTPL
jgi:hypothetical protein